jgi:hypothetical protein
MNIFAKLLPIILLSFIFYILIYNIYPKYQETISLVKQINELKNKIKKIESIEKFLQSLNQNNYLQEIYKQKNLLDLWLPTKLQFDSIVASLVGIFQANLFPLKSFQIEIQPDPFYYNNSVLPVKKVNIKFTTQINNQNLMNFLNSFEQNMRLMSFKKVKISSSESSEFIVETYYLSTELNSQK